MISSVLSSVSSSSENFLPNEKAQVISTLIMSLLNMNLQPHRVIQHPVFLQKIHLFASSKHFSPVIFNSVSSTWSETQLEFHGAHLCWEAFWKASLRNEKKLKVVMVWCCRIPKKTWIFENIVNSGIDFHTRYTVAIHPLDVLLAKAKEALDPRAKIGPEDEDGSKDNENNDTNKNNDSDGEDEKTRRLKQFHKYMNLLSFILDTGRCVPSSFALKNAILLGNTMGSFDLLKELHSKGVFTHKTILSSSSTSATKNPSDSYTEVLQSPKAQDELNLNRLITLCALPRPFLEDAVELYLQLGADPFQKTSDELGWLSTAKQYPIQSAIEKGNVELVDLMFRKARPEALMMSKDSVRTDLKMTKTVIDWAIESASRYIQLEKVLEHLKKLKDEIVNN